MAKYRVFISIDDVLYAEVDADNETEAMRIVQEEVTCHRTKVWGLTLHGVPPTNQERKTYLD